MASTLSIAMDTFHSDRWVPVGVHLSEYAEKRVAPLLGWAAYLLAGNNLRKT
jgi:hypothetical protein